MLFLQRVPNTPPSSSTACSNQRGHTAAPINTHSPSNYFAKSGLERLVRQHLPALVARVRSETGYPQLALVAHSQGTTETLVALAKEQRPEIERRISVACLLAPAAYAGQLIEKMYFKFEGD